MRNVFFICFLLILGVDFGIAYSQEIFDNGHDGDDIFIFINGQEKSLQDAIDGGDFSRDYTGGRLHGPVRAGHVDNIFVNVNGFDKSLQDAINDGSLCSSSLGGDKVYSEDVLLGHSAEDVLVDFNGEKSLQDAINEGLFGYGVWSPSASSYCDTETFTQYNCGRSRTGVWGTMDCSCVANVGSSCDNGYWGTASGCSNSDYGCASYYAIWYSSPSGCSSTPSIEYFGPTCTYVGFAYYDPFKNVPDSGCFDSSAAGYPISNTYTRVDSGSGCTYNKWISVPGIVQCDGSCSGTSVPIDCIGYWDMNYGSCSATACGTTGRYDKLWVTTTPASGGGTACPSPTFVDNGGNVCSAPACAAPGSIDIQEFAINLEINECYSFTISTEGIVGSLTHSTSGGTNCITSNGRGGLKWDTVGFKTYTVSGTDGLGNTVSDVARIVVSSTASPGSIDIQESTISLDVNECYSFTISTEGIVGSLTHSTSGGTNCITSNGRGGLKWSSPGIKTYTVSGTDGLGNTVSDVAKVIVYFVSDGSIDIQESTISLDVNECYYFTITKNNIVGAIWDDTDGGSYCVASNGLGGLKWSSPGIKTYTVSGVDRLGKTVSDVAKVIVYLLVIAL